MSLHTVEKLLREIGDELPELKRRVDDLDSRTRFRKWAAGGDDKPKFSLFKALRGLTLGNWEDASHEREVLFDHRVRDMGTTPDSGGGYLVPAQQIPELIEQLYAETTVIRAGATVLPDLKGSPVTIPKQTAGATAYWVGENSAITPSDLTFGQVNLTPKKVAALVKLSNELLAMSLPQAEAVVRRDLVEQISLAIDLAALRGSGASNQPLGVANTPGISTVAASGGLTDLDLFTEMSYRLEAANALKGSLGFIFHPAVKRELRKLRVPQFSGDTGGDYMLRLVAQALMSGDAAIEQGLGHPFYTSTQVPTTLGGGSDTEIYFGNWADLLIGTWGGLSILASPHAGDAFAKDQTWVRIVMSVDVAVRHPESFCLCNDLTLS